MTSILEQFQKLPWCQHHSYLYDRDGNNIAHCLWASIRRFEDRKTRMSALAQAVRELFPARVAAVVRPRGHVYDEETLIITLNDHPDTTLNDILRVIKRADELLAASRPPSVEGSCS